MAAYELFVLPATTKMASPELPVLPAKTKMAAPELPVLPAMGKMATSDLSILPAMAKMSASELSVLTASAKMVALDLPVPWHLIPPAPPRHSWPYANLQPDATVAIDSDRGRRERESKKELSSAINLWPWRPSRHHHCSN
ncbi:hypothetical protein E1301_Tti015501 [Triplophysa tibetana]|uniref:Uncharacterized protein n=1 Tax=Triplophysa tibetana TaxID=1572043 RepID=A0A5A9N2T8_9TELE|nr:hypothetical protein E1301_Tti015501 [Triplophysa tibetana]